MSSGHVQSMDAVPDAGASASSSSRSSSAGSPLSEIATTAVAAAAPASSPPAVPPKDKGLDLARGMTTDTPALQGMDMAVSMSSTIAARAAEAGPSITSGNRSAISVPVATSTAATDGGEGSPGPSSGARHSVPLSPTASAHAHTHGWTHSRSSSTSTARPMSSGGGAAVAGPSAAHSAMPTPAATPAKRAAGATDRAAKRRSPPSLSPDPAAPASPATPTTPFSAGVANTFGFSTFAQSYPSAAASGPANATTGTSAVPAPSMPRTPPTPPGLRPYFDASVPTDTSQTYGYSLAWQSAWDYRAAPRRRASASMASTAHSHVTSAPRLPSLHTGEAFGAAFGLDEGRYASSPTTAHNPAASSRQGVPPHLPYSDTTPLASPSTTLPTNGHSTVGDLAVLGYNYPDNAGSDPRRAAPATSLADRADEWALVSDFGPVSRAQLLSVRGAGGVGGAVGTAAGPSHATSADPELRAIDNTLARVEEQLQAYYAHVATRRGQGGTPASSAGAPSPAPSADLDAAFAQRWASVAAMRESIRRVRDAREEQGAQTQGAQTAGERFAALAQERRAAHAAASASPEASVAEPNVTATRTTVAPRDTTWLESPTIETPPRRAGRYSASAYGVDRRPTPAAMALAAAAESQALEFARERAAQALRRPDLASAAAADDVHSFEGPRAPPLMRFTDDFTPEPVQAQHAFTLSPSPLVRLPHRAPRADDAVPTLPVDTRDNVGPATHDPEGNPRRDIDIEYLRASTAAAGARAAADIQSSARASDHADAAAAEHQVASTVARARWELPGAERRHGQNLERLRAQARQAQAEANAQAQAQAQAQSQSTGQAPASTPQVNPERESMMSRLRRRAAAGATDAQRPWLDVYAPGPHPDTPGASTQLTVNGPPAAQRARARPGLRFPVDGGDPIGGLHGAGTPATRAPAPAPAAPRPADGADMASLLSSGRFERHDRLVAELSAARAAMLDASANGLDGVVELQTAGRLTMAAQALHAERERIRGAEGSGARHASRGGAAGAPAAQATAPPDSHITDVLHGLTRLGDLMGTDHGGITSLLGTARPSCPKSLSAAMSAADRAKVMRGIMRAVRTMTRPTRRRAAQSTLKKSRWDEAQLETDRDDACAICQDDYPPDAKVSVTPCGHMFHTTCVDTWFNTPSSSTCPMCRRDLAAMALATRISLDGPDTARRAWLEAPADLAVAHNPFF